MNVSRIAGRACTELAQEMGKANPDHAPYTLTRNVAPTLPCAALRLSTPAAESALETARHGK